MKTSVIRSLGLTRVDGWVPLYAGWVRWFGALVDEFGDV